ncbi:LysM peptidoglycan-binding domain-containing protein [Vagococcus salmoninarum]|uniref:LysM peptidoglycan-binding domain-containing protein n=1 Tax=Vagococcus salmoninarum TaxID=2739 RepID=UPI0028D52B47|nr:LysM peptidoglycan-binding domain-containing protein [Vagococcus salmoninarum]
MLELGFITNSGDRQKTIGNMDSLVRKLAEAIINRKLSGAPAPSGSSSSATFHTVVRGDTLYSLSRRYGSTVNQIKTWNNLTSDTIVIGQRLRVTSGSSSQSTQAI